MVFVEESLLPVNKCLHPNLMMAHLLYTYSWMNEVEWNLMVDGVGDGVGYKDRVMFWKRNRFVGICAYHKVQQLSHD